MSWRFRRIFRVGPFRTTVGKSGVGFSLGIPGCRMGVSPNGRKYISVGIPGTGFYWIKYFDKTFSKSQNDSGPYPVNNPTPKSGNTSWWKQKEL